MRPFPWTAFVFAPVPTQLPRGVRLLGRPWAAEQSALFLVFVPVLLLPSGFLRAHVLVLWGLGAIVAAWLALTAARAWLDFDSGTLILRQRWLGFTLVTRTIPLGPEAALSLERLSPSGLRGTVPPVLLRLEAAMGPQVLGRLYWDEEKLAALRLAFRNVRGVRFAPPRSEPR